MKKWTSIKKHKNLFLFLFILFLFGIITGILFYFKQDIGVLKTILINTEDVFKHNVFSLKNIFIHLCISLILIASAFLFLGPPILILVLFFEGIGIGFIIPILFSIYKWKFLFSFTCYFLFIKLFYLFFLFLFFLKLVQFSKDYWRYFKTKKINFVGPLKSTFGLCLLILLNDVITFAINNKVLIFLLG